MRHTSRLQGDGGVVGGIEAIPFGVLTFVVGSLLVANAWAVIDAKFAVSSAAREAARQYVEAPDRSAAARGAAERVGETIDEHGREGHRAHVEIMHDDGRAWGRCTRVRVTVSYPVPAVTLPWIGGYGGGFDVRSTHSEIVDPFRADLPGSGTC